MKYTLSIIAIMMGFIWYYPYFYDIYKWKTKPHAFSWLIWFVVSWIGFAIQVFENWWIWSSVLWFVSATCLALTIIWFYQRQIQYWVLDWVSLFLAAISICLWIFTKNPFYSVLLISFIDFLGCVPTYKKIYYQPESETLFTWYFMDIRLLIWIVALSTYSFNTVFYPFAMFTVNAIAILLIHYRRAVLS